MEEKFGDKVPCLSALFGNPAGQPSILIVSPQNHSQLIPQPVRNIALIGDEKGAVEIEVPKSPIHCRSTSL